MSTGSMLEGFSVREEWENSWLCVVPFDSLALQEHCWVRVDKTSASRDCTNTKCLSIRLQREGSLFLPCKCSREPGVFWYFFFFIVFWFFFFLWIEKHEGSAYRFGCSEITAEERVSLGASTWKLLQPFVGKWDWPGESYAPLIILHWNCRGAPMSVIMSFSKSRQLTTGDVYWLDRALQVPASPLRAVS